MSAAKKKWLLHAKVEKSWPLYLISWPLHVMLNKATKHELQVAPLKVSHVAGPHFLFQGWGLQKLLAPLLSWLKSLATQCLAGSRRIMAFVAWAFTSAGRNARLDETMPVALGSKAAFIKRFHAAAKWINKRKRERLWYLSTNQKERAHECLGQAPPGGRTSW